MLLLPLSSSTCTVNESIDSTSTVTYTKEGQNSIVFVYAGLSAYMKYMYTEIKNSDSCMVVPLYCVQDTTQLLEDHLYKQKHVTGFYTLSSVCNSLESKGSMCPASR